MLKHHRSAEKDAGCISLCIAIFMISWLLLTGSAHAAVNLAWDANAESNLAGYKLYYKTGVGGTPYDGIGLEQGNSPIIIPFGKIVDPKNPVFSLSGLKENTAYFFALTAYNAQGYESTFSNEVRYDAGTVNLPAPPSIGTIPPGNMSLAYTDSEETIGSDTAAVHAIDGDPATFWHTAWEKASPGFPHEVAVDLGGVYAVERFDYLPRQDSPNGRIKEYQFFVSMDGISWGNPVAAGQFVNSVEKQGATFSPVTGRYVKLLALSEVNGNPWASVAELTVFGVPYVSEPAAPPVSGTVDPPQESMTGSISSGNMSLVYSDSEETIGSDTAAVHAIDGDPATFWHTAWEKASPGFPHEVAVDLGGVYAVERFDYLPRQDSPNGRIKEYQFFVSMDGISWGNPVAAGQFVNSVEKQGATFSPVTGRYVKLLALSEVNGNPWASVAELMVFGVPYVSEPAAPPVSGTVDPPQESMTGSISSGNMSLVYTDSEETIGSDTAAIHAIDGDPATFWHTAWEKASPGFPHEVAVDLGGVYAVERFDYLPRQDSPNGRIKEYQFFVSMDGISWGNPVAAGQFVNSVEKQGATFSPVTGRYVKLLALSEVNGNPWASVAELMVFGVPEYPISQQNVVDIQPDTVDIQRAVYDIASQSLTIVATSDRQPDVLLTLEGFGPLNWKPWLNFYRNTFTGVTSPPVSITVTSSGGGFDSQALADKVLVSNVIYSPANGGTLTVIATSDRQPNVKMTAIGFGPLDWKPRQNFYRKTFTRVGALPAGVTVISSGGGSYTYCPAASS